jgi:hypothetical protein
MNIKHRISILKKIAITAPNSVSGTPQRFIVAELYPTAVTGLTPANTDKLTLVMSNINQAIYYSSNGKFDLMDLKNSSFIKDVSGEIPDLRNLILFSQLIYNNLLTDAGAKFEKQLSPQEIKRRIDLLIGSMPLNNLPSTNPTGQLSTKIHGNLKELIKTKLREIK